LNSTSKELHDWDDYYKENDVQTMPWFLEKLDHDVLNEINSKALKKGKFLDLGTGPGTQAKQLSSLGFDVIGSDLSQSAIEKAKKLYSEPQFVVDDILNSKFSDNEFDYIFDRGIFHIFEKNQLSSYLSQIKRILKENGLLFLKCMSVDEKNIPDGAGPTLYSQDQIKEFFENDFEIETTKDSLFYGASSEFYKAIFTVLKNKKN
jgi:SAM-dependent methyltransferase